MGANTSVCAVLGVKIDMDKIVFKKETRQCTCEVENIETMNYCPNCGKLVFREEKDFIKDFNWGFGEVEGKTLCGYSVFMDRESDDSVFVGVRTKSIDVLYNEEATKVDIPDDVKAFKEEMRDKLEPLGLWDEKMFGMWSCGYCSA